MERQLSSVSRFCPCVVAVKSKANRKKTILFMRVYRYVVSCGFHLCTVRVWRAVYNCKITALRISCKIIFEILVCKNTGKLCRYYEMSQNFMFVNVFLYHFGSNFVRFERKKCHLCGTVWNMCRAERKKWGEMWETHEFFRRGIWAERLEKRFCNFMEISTWQKPENTRHIF